MPMETEPGILRFDVNGPLPVAETIQTLFELSRAYNALYAADTIVSDISPYRGRVIIDPPYPFGPWQSWRAHLVNIETDPAIYVPQDQRLSIQSAQFNSPGLMSILGNITQLAKVVQWCKDWNDRRKQYGKLDVAHKKADLIKKYVDILKECGIPQSEIQRFVNTLLYEPLDRAARGIEMGPLRNPRTMRISPPSNPENPSGRKMLDDQ